MDEHELDIINSNAVNIIEQRALWRRQGWAIPELRGGKQNWFLLTKNLVNLIGTGKAMNLDEKPDIPEIQDIQPWRSYTPFLKSIGLTYNQSGTLHLSEVGIKFLDNPTEIYLADLIQSKFRLFGEVLEFLNSKPSTIKDTHEHFNETYGIRWENLSNIRKRMSWLEILELVENIGNNKWTTTTSGKKVLEYWQLVSPDALDNSNSRSKNIEVSEPPTEIAILLQRLFESPELHSKRSTYNIWAPSPNRIDNLRIIIQAASDRISREDLFHFIGKEFNLKKSSAESMLPFLKASGLLEEVGRNVYIATAAAMAWLKTGNDLDFIRIIHSHMKFVGEILLVCENDITRNKLYSYAKFYKLNTEKVRWIVGFLLEAGLLEEPQYLHLKSTSFGLHFVSSLPLAEKPSEKIQEGPKPILKKPQKEFDPISNELNHIIELLLRSSRDPIAEGLAPGQCFEETIARIFCYMGFDSKRVGGPGDTDVIVRWKDNSGKVITAIVDGKSKSNGKVSHSDISDIAIDTHKDKNSADFVGIVGPGFSGETIKNHAHKKSYALITDEQLAEIARTSEKIGLSPQDISLIFQVPNGFLQLDELINSTKRELEVISSVVTKLAQDQEILGNLSPRDLWLILRETETSPSLEELLNITEILSTQQIGILRMVDKSQSPEHTTYVLNDIKKAARRLRALASAIDNTLSN